MIPQRLNSRERSHPRSRRCVYICGCIRLPPPPSLPLPQLWRRQFSKLSSTVFSPSLFIIVFSVAFLQIFFVFCGPCAVEVLPAQHLRASSKDSRGMFSFRVRRAQPGRTSGFFEKNVLVTQHSNWTAKRVRRGLFWQSIVDFSKNSRSSDSSSHLQESAKGAASHRVQRQAKKTPRAPRSFAQAKALGAKTQILVVPTLMTAVPFRGRL